MKIKLYQQRMINYTYSKDKLPIPIGEDAIPFIGKDLLFTADGLGGDGGYPHTLLKKEIFNKELFFKTVYGNMYNEELLPQYLKDYIDETFSYIFKIGYEEYMSSVKKMKTSGFFASRLMSIMFLCEMYFNEEFNVDKMIEEASNDVRAFENKYSKKFEEVIKEKLKKAATNGNFVLEGMIKNVPVLPTTLAAIFYKEEEGYVKTISVWAGDSRVYAFNLRGDDCATGLSQITEDDEVDEVMNNKISANQNFWVNCKYKEIPKPCILFGSSDGCFDTVTSRIDFEWILLDAFKNADSTSEYLSNLKEIFGNYSPDDSATFAWKSFGFKDGFKEKSEDEVEIKEEKLEEKETTENIEVTHDIEEDDYKIIKQYALVRIQNILDKYVSLMPDIFDVDYNNEYAKLNEEYRAKLKEVKKAIDESPLVKKEILNYILINKASNLEYDDHLKEIDDEYNSSLEELRAKILEYVKNHWLEFREKPRIALFGSKTFSQIEKINKDIDFQKEKSDKIIQAFISEIEKFNDFAIGSLNKIKEEKYNEIVIPDDFKQNLSNEVFAFINKAYARNETEYTTEIKRLLAEKEQLIKKLCLEEEDKCKAISEKIAKREFEPITDFQKEFIILVDSKMAELKEAKRAKMESEKSKKDDAVLKYYNKHYAEVIEENKDLVIDNDLIIKKYRECKVVLDKAKQILEICHKRDEIYADYEVNYCKYFRGDN